MKGALRTAMKARRSEVPVHDRDLAGAELVRRVRALEGPGMIFVSIGDELPTGAVLGDLLMRGVEVAVPRITGPGTMEAARVEGPLIPGRFRVPTSRGPVTTVDWVLVPGLAFDRRGGRLGYGAGFYDRWIATHPGVRTVGVGFSCQEVAEVPMEPHDRFLDDIWLL